MPDSPLARSPYAVLGVAEHASDAALRVAYRRKLRETHPDTGGQAPQFDLVQRAWELVGTPAARARYDAGVLRDADEPLTWAPRAPAPRGSSRPRAQLHGNAGAWTRARYLEALAEWAGPAVANPYDPRLVRSAPVDVRHLLATAIAEEETALALGALGIGFTVWNDVRTDPGEKIDHLVLGPTGLWGLSSEDWGGGVSARGGEVVGAVVPAEERPVHALAARARAFERLAKVRFSALAIVVADGSAPDGVVSLGTIRGATTFLVERPRIAHLVGMRVPGFAFGGTDLFEVRTRVQNAARFI